MEGKNKFCFNLFSMCHEQDLPRCWSNDRYKKFINPLMTNYLKYFFTGDIERNRAAFDSYSKKMRGATEISFGYENKFVQCSLDARHCLKVLRELPLPYIK